MSEPIDLEMPPFSTPNPQSSASATNPSRTFESTCDRAFLDLLAELPEVAALFSVDDNDGLTLRDDALTDWSPVGETVRMTRMVNAHRALAATDEDAATHDDEARRTRAVFREFLEHPTFEPLVGVAGKAFMQHPYLVTQEGGVQTELPLYFVNLHPLECRDDAELYLAKLHRVPATLRGLIESLRDREACALIPPRFLLQQAAAEIRAFVHLDPADNPIAATFAERLRARAASKPARPELTAAAIDTLTSRVRDAVAHRVYPAYDALMRALTGQIAHAQDEPGVWRLPDGDAYYAYELRCQTSTDLSADAIHALGLELVEELTATIHSAFDAQGLSSGTLAERYQRLAADAGWEQSAAGRREVLAGCHRLLADIDARLPEAFATRPQAPLVIEPVPAFCEAARTTTLHPASPDGSRPAIFEINVARELASPKWELPTQVYHEGVPGHHLQFAIAQERKSLSLLRRKVVFQAYVEGWAKYAEQLPWDLRWNEDPIWRLGVLRRELISTANLALDTGIHHRRWTREQGVRFAIESTGMDEGFARYLVDRIAARPGQVCSYMMGLRKLRQLRARYERASAQTRGGFSLPAFHDRLLLHGALPLAELERAVLGDLATLETGA